MLEIVFGPCADFVEGLFLGSPSAEHPLDAIDQFGPRHQELLFDRKLQRVAQRRPAPRHDADLVHRVGMLAVGGHQRVAHFVKGDAPLLFRVEPPALALGTGDDFFDRVFEVLLIDR